MKTSAARWASWKAAGLAACTFVIAASPVRAGPWLGRTAEIDGVEHVLNPAEPMEPPVTEKPEALWRIGGSSEAEGEIFGFIRSIAADAAGDVYLLDAQLSEVRVFSADGSYLHTIGREGEGPGEFRRPRALFFLPDGTLGVVQSRPGKVVLLDPGGEPAGEFEPEGFANHGDRLPQGAASCDSGVVIFSMESRLQPDKAVTTSVLASYDPAGKELGRFFEFERVADFAHYVADESKYGLLSWTVGPDCRVYGVTSFGKYEIEVWSISGGLERVIEREYEPLERTPEEIEEVKKGFVISGVPHPTITVSDYHPDVFRMYARPDGSLWVLTSRGSRNGVEGSIGTFDVFDARGRFLRQVTLLGEGDPRTDHYYFLGDRLYIARRERGALDAMFKREDSSGEGKEEAEPEPMEVICYRLDS